MSSYLYSYPEQLEFSEGNRPPGDLVFDRKFNNRFVYLSGSPLSYPDGVLIGAWHTDGSIMEGIPIDPAWFQMNPTGNKNGDATGALGYHNWMGMVSARQVQASPVDGTLPEFPADDQPIVLLMERYWDDTPGWTGWGWKATIAFSDPSRSPNARAIGIYDNDWNYQYTTGAFVWTDTGQVDDNDQPVFKWQTKNPPGRATKNKEPLYYAILFGAALEGKNSLAAEKESQQNFFWKENQVLPGGSDWVESGETVVGNYGTVTATSSNDPFIVTSRVRIEGQEATVTALWVGAGQGIVLTPNVKRTIGAIIEIWQ